MMQSYHITDATSGEVIHQGGCLAKSDKTSVDELS
jgi:hypothetical protein